MKLAPYEPLSGSNYKFFSPSSDHVFFLPAAGKWRETGSSYHQSPGSHGFPANGCWSHPRHLRRRASCQRVLLWQHVSGNESLSQSFSACSTSVLHVVNFNDIYLQFEFNSETDWSSAHSLMYS